MGADHLSTSWASLLIDPAPTDNGAGWASGLIPIGSSTPASPWASLAIGLAPVPSPVPALTSPSSSFAGSIAKIPTFRPVTYPWQWYFVTARFDALFENIGMLENRVADGTKKQAGIRDCLNRYYWGYSSETANSMLIGSWAKYTRVRPSNDIDLMFLLPAEVYFRFEERSGNKQSQLLQEVRGVLSDQGKYQNTDINGDRQVVVVNFDSIPVEILLAFTCQDGSIIICDTKHGGYYKAADPAAELADLHASDRKWNGNTCALARMGKKWLQNRDVQGLKAFMIERLAVEFLATWPHSLHDRFWYDWMIRDFFLFLLGRAGGWIFMPGTGEVVALGNDWKIEAARAYKHAYLACVHEQANQDALAGEAWQEIFGSAIPARIS
jgi:hypothetical protein